ncbi:MAG: HRDC domain-containing protein, partial [Gammaproteobacteria bacterium]|nr:HRDC domain-containing protein [Gammaproteobacteria bacterium]
RADWCKRPLTEDLIQYAIEDVVHLGALYETLSRQLADQGRMQWLKEDCAELDRRELYQSDPEQAYVKLSRGHSLPITQQHALKALANWRERTAQEMDLPRNWVASDANLMDIVASAPHGVPDLTNIEGLRREFSKRHGKEVAAILEECASQNPRSRVWDTPERLTREQKVLREKLMDVLRTRARELNIAVPVLGTRKDVDTLVRGGKHNALLRGWRFQVVGESLRRMMARKQVPEW